MVNTRQGSTSQSPNPPPNPPSMTPLEQLIHNQNEMFRMFMTSQNRPATPTSTSAPPQPRETSYADFWATHPPTFLEATDPLEADNFLRIIEAKFALLNCTSRQKTLFAAQHLPGSARGW